MTYIFMAVHYPAPGRRDQVYASMARMAAGVSRADAPNGLIEIGPWLEHGGDRVVGFFRWQSREAFEAAMSGSGIPNDTVHDGERRPRDYFHLEQPDVTES